MIFFKFLILNILMLLFISCTTEPKGETTNNHTLILKNQPRKTPTDSLRLRYDDCDYTTHFVSQLGLKDLQLGVDSVVIRFWYGHSLGLYRNVVILEVNKKGWTAELIDFKVAWDYSLRKYKITVHKKKQAVPMYGWENLIKSINTINVLSFSNSDEYNLVKPGADGDSYVIEIANKKVYNIYCFIESKSYSNKFITAKKLVEMYELLERDFSLRFGHYNITLSTNP